MTIPSIIKHFGESGINNGQFSSPAGICTNRQHEIFIADEFNHRIQKFSPEGDFISTFGSFGHNNSQFYYPTSIACDKEDNIFITDRWNHRIQKFSANGTFLLSFGSYGSKQGLFSEPYGITVSKNNYVFITDSNNHRIQEFDSNGNFIKAFGTGGPNQTFYESSEFKNSFIFKKWINQNNKFNTVENRFHKNKYKLGVLEYPKNIFFENDTIWVCDSGNDRIVNFSLNGDILTTYGPFEKNTASFSKPTDISVINNFAYVVSDMDNSLYQINLQTNEEHFFKIDNTKCLSLCVKDETTLLVGDRNNNNIFEIKI